MNKIKIRGIDGVDAELAGEAVDTAWGCTAEAYSEALSRFQPPAGTYSLTSMYSNAYSTAAMTTYQNKEREIRVEEPVKRPKSPFEIRVDLWRAVNEEIAQVEEFLSNASTKKSKGGLFRVSCFEKNRKEFTVKVNYDMELPLGLQEKMIRAAEEYLEELKKQREDMDRGYE